MVTKEQVIEKLKTVFDPHIPISVYDLGLILDIKIQNEFNVYIKMTFTTHACPMKQLIAQKIEENIKEIKGVKEVVIDISYDVKWTPNMINSEFRKNMEV
ncbi:MAG: metal-sulfur cluster assembly factor [Candidatus Micrarchaeia archaeon]|jgi:metal-sulfur cluster biosynthetic enzyme